MTTFTDPDIGPQIKRDQHGRYLLPHPDTGQIRAWTRVTTFADVVTSKHALHGWDEANVAWGLAHRKDLISLASSVASPRDPQLREIIDAAKEASDAAAARNKGQAIHAWTEQVDRDQAGLADIPVPEDRDDVRAYVDTLEAAGMTIYEDKTGPWIERVVMLPQLDDGKTVAGVAGQLDRIVTHPDWPAPRILDLKTGQNIIRFGMSKIPLQLAMYAHATQEWDPVTDTIGPMPRVDFERAIVAHVPAGTGHCELYNVNIAQGWRMVELAQKVRAWQRLDGGDLVEQITPMRAGPTLRTVPEPGSESLGLRASELLEARVAWITGRCRNIQAFSAPRDPDSPIRQLGNAWPDDVPNFRNGGPTTHAHVDAIIAACDKVEANAQLAFEAPDPGAPVITKATAKPKNKRK